MSPHRAVRTGSRHPYIHTGKPRGGVRRQCVYYFSPRSLWPHKHFYYQLRGFLSTAVFHCLLPMATLVALFWKRFLFCTFCVDYSKILLIYPLKLGEDLSTFQQKEWQSYLILTYFPLSRVFPLIQLYHRIGAKAEFQFSTRVNRTYLELHHHGLTPST